MATGACGINCDVCGLRLLDICSSCGPGTGEEAGKKIAAQIRLFGMPCLILECARKNNVDYCMRDCPRFPCEVFRKGPYPFCEGFLRMQERRRKEEPSPRSPSGTQVRVPDVFWDDLGKKGFNILCSNAGATPLNKHTMVLPHLGRTILVDLRSHAVKRIRADGDWEETRNATLKILCLVYLLNVGPDPLSGKLIGVRQLKDAHFFQGPHELRLDSLVEYYGNDLEGFGKAAESLGGEKVDLADAAYRIDFFPKIPVYYLFWRSDEEFSSRVSILLDSSIERYLQADAVWGLVNMTTNALVRAKMVKADHDEARISH